MNDQNILHRMLAKGDAIRNQYENFDFSKLDDEQHKIINRLTFFSKHRERILKKFNGTNINFDTKIAFIDQHSMKLGNNIFYDLESSRQEYITCFDVMPYTSFTIGFLIFCGYAIRRPLTQKLYKEGLYSLLMGSSISYTYVHYYKRHYLQKVDEVYNLMNKHFEQNPILTQISEDEKVIKNFGFTRFADNDDYEGSDEDQEPDPGIFEGDCEQENQENKSRLIDYFYGNQNADTIKKLQNFQQSTGAGQNANAYFISSFSFHFRYYTNQQLGVYDNNTDSRGPNRNPWDAQQKYQNKAGGGQMRPVQEITGVKNEIFIHKDTLKFIQLEVSGQSSRENGTSYTLTFQFDSMHECSIRAYQGCFEKVEEHNGAKKVTFYPKKDSNFEKLFIQESKFSEGKSQWYPQGIIVVNMNNFFIKGDDYSKATMTYYPLVIEMSSQESSLGGADGYTAIYYMQFQFQRGGQFIPQIMKQKILVNGELFELSEAYGLNSSRTDDNSTKECVICLTNEKDTITKPCKHVSLCNSCAQVVYQSEKRCPICRQGKPLNEVNVQIVIREIIPIKIK